MADYGDGGGPAISGREADDIYAPTAVLADLGATVPLFGDVTRQVADDVAWERIGIVRYPSRASFFAMQDRDDFQKQYVHKKAGMETTIVMGCVPLVGGRARRCGQRCRWSCGCAGSPTGRRPAPDPDGVVPVAHFAVDGVILGDGRRWDDVRFDRVDDDVRCAALADTEVVADQVVVVIDPLIEDLIGSVATAGE